MLGKLWEKAVGAVYEGLYNGEPVAIKKAKSKYLTDKAVEELRMKKIMFQWGWNPNILCDKKDLPGIPVLFIGDGTDAEGFLISSFTQRPNTAVGNTLSDRPGCRLGTQGFTWLSHSAPGFKKPEYSVGMTVCERSWRILVWQK